MRHDENICAAIPMTAVSFAAYWCHVHQAWCYTARVYRQDGEDVLSEIHTTDGSLGPFDGTDAVLAAFERALDAAAASLVE